MADSSPLGRPVTSVCVYCGSSETTEPAYLDLATRFGAALAGRGLRLVYGGGSIGLMGRCAKAAFAAGGDVLGVMPKFLERREIVLENVPHRMVDTMHERKQIMFEQSDAFVVLPGGLGTFDEFFEVAVEAQLGVHEKPIVVVNVNGYYNALDAMLHATVEAGLARKKILTLYYLSDGPEAALKILEGRLNA